MSPGRFSEPTIPQMSRTQRMLEVTENDLADHVQDLIGRDTLTRQGTIVQAVC